MSTIPAAVPSRSTSLGAGSSAPPYDSVGVVTATSSCVERLPAGPVPDTAPRLPLPAPGSRTVAGVELTPAEGRVLGCLVEKELTTPQAYPLTDNALVTACNQTTNRDPVVSYDVATVRLAVRSLREKQLLRTVHRTGERTDKHRHELDRALELLPAELALLAVLLLRGPQTPGELRARSERLHAFASPDEVEQTLCALASRAEPLVARLERQPGRKESRYAQLLVPDAGADAVPAAPGAPGPPAREHVPAAERTPAPALLGTTDDRPDPPGPRADVDELRTEVDGLRVEVDGLRVEVERLRDRLDGG